MNADVCLSVEVTGGCTRDVHVAVVTVATSASEYCRRRPAAWSIACRPQTVLCEIGVGEGSDLHLTVEVAVGLARDVDAAVVARNGHRALTSIPAVDAQQLGPLPVARRRVLGEKGWICSDHRRPVEGQNALVKPVM